jgi:hypothetical protein
MALVDMKMSAEEAREEYGSAPLDDGDLPEYPYGLTICLDDESLAKLGITQLPTVGSTMTINARVEVCSTSQYSNRKRENETSMSLQITAMEISGDSAPSDAASLLYPD